MSEQRTERVEIKLTPKEVQQLDALGAYLKEKGILREGTRSEIIRHAILVDLNMALRAIEERVY